MKPIKSVRLLPNAITSANLFCGFLSMIKSAHALMQLSLIENAKSLGLDATPYITECKSFLIEAALYIAVGMIFDALDGKIARMVNGTSDFGAQLDSLCDAVSFCVAPALLMYATCMLVPLIPDWYVGDVVAYHKLFPEEFIFISAVIYVLCGVMRLARFNVETTAAEEDHRYFKGLPTPAGAGVIVSFVMLLDNKAFVGTESLVFIGECVINILPVLTLVTALLMVTSVPYVHIVGLFGRAKASFEMLVLVIVLAAVAYVNIFLTLFVGIQLYLLTGLVMMNKKFFIARKTTEEEQTNI